MKAYREKFPHGRCAEEFAKLIAPPADLTGAKLVVLPGPGAKYILKNAVYTVKNTADINAFAFSAEGTTIFLATSNSRHILQKWELATGRVSTIPNQGANSVVYDSLSPDGNWLGSAQIFPPVFYKRDQATNKLLNDGKPNQLNDPLYPIGYKGPVSLITPYPASWSKNAVYHSFFIGTADPKVAQRIYVWDVAAQRLISSVQVPEKDANVNRLAVSDDGHWAAALVSWTEEHPLKQTCRWICEGGCGVGERASLDWTRCAVDKSNVRIYDIKKGKLLRVIGQRKRNLTVAEKEIRAFTGVTADGKEEQLQGITAFDFSLDSSRIFIGYKNGEIYVENVQTGKLEYDEPLFANSGHSIMQIDELPDQKWLLVQSEAIITKVFASNDKVPDKRFWLVNSLVPLGQPVRTKLEPGKRLCLSGRSVPIEGSNYCPSYVLAKSMFDPTDVKLQSSEGQCVSIGSTQIKGSGDSCPSYIKLWSMIDHDPSERRAISPDSRFFVAGGAEASHLWDLHSGQISATLRLLPDGGYVTSTPSGEFTASDDAEPHLAIEIGKRRWPLADVPAFKKQFFRKDGINLLAPPR